jgi:hypothetical protein
VITDTEEKRRAVTDEFKEDAVAEIHRECPDARELSGEFVRPQERMEWFLLEECTTFLDAHANQFRKFPVIMLELRSVPNRQRHTRDENHRSS